MIHIAIIEDSKTDALRIQEYLKRYASEQDQHFKISYFPEAVSFLEDYQPIYNIIFMDIDLPNMNGMTAARKLREFDSNVILIFSTNLTNYAIKGYEVNALDYMVKPIDYYSLAMKLKRALANIEMERGSHITISQKNGMVRLLISEIHYVEIITHQLIYHTKQGTYETRDTIRNAETMLSPHHFFRCSNSYLINLKYVTAFQGGIVTIGEDCISISRPRKKAFVQALTDYFGVNI